MNIADKLLDVLDRATAPAKPRTHSEMVENSSHALARKVARQAQKNMPAEFEGASALWTKLKTLQETRHVKFGGTAADVAYFAQQVKHADLLDAAQLESAFSGHTREEHVERFQLARQALDTAIVRTAQTLKPIRLAIMAQVRELAAAHVDGIAAVEAKVADGYGLDYEPSPTVRILREATDFLETQLFDFVLTEAA